MRYLRKYRVRADSPEALEAFRTDLEIHMFHIDDVFKDSTTLLMLFAALGTGLALLQGDKAAIVTPLLSIVLVYEVRETRHPIFAALFCVVACASVVDLPRTLLPGHGSEPPYIALPLGLFLSALYILGSLLYLRRLQALRAAIPLPPAPHLHITDAPLSAPSEEDDGA